MESTTILNVRYVPATRALYIQFVAGQIYRYEDVPDVVAKELLAADSLGEYFNKEIKGEYVFEKVSEFL